MNIDEAINKAADHIEQYPESYAFGQGAVMRKEDIPTTWRGPGSGPGGYQACMLARIGEMAGFRTGIGHETVARELLGMGAESFYQEIRAATVGAASYEPDATRNAKTIPAAMRKVAKKYEGIPVSVLSIVNGERRIVIKDLGHGLVMEYA